MEIAGKEYGSSSLFTLTPEEGGELDGIGIQAKIEGVLPEPVLACMRLIESFIEKCTFLSLYTAGALPEKTPSYSLSAKPTALSSEQQADAPSLLRDKTSSPCLYSTTARHTATALQTLSIPTASQRVPSPHSPTHTPKLIPTIYRHPALSSPSSRSSLTPHAIYRKEMQHQASKPPLSSLRLPSPLRSSSTHLPTQAQLASRELSHTQPEETKKQQQDKEQEGGGFGQSQDDHSPDDSRHNERTASYRSIPALVHTPLYQYGMRDSELTALFSRRISQFDVLLLFLEILKIDIKSREQEKRSRQLEQILQLEEMQLIVENYNKQAFWQATAAIGGGVLGTISAISPIVGFLKGNWIIQKIGLIFPSFRNVDRDQFFKGVSKITQSMADMQKGLSGTYQAFAEGKRTYHQTWSDIHRAQWEERTRNIDDLKDNWKSIENFLSQFLQMYHDAIRQLYSI